MNKSSFTEAQVKALGELEKKLSSDITTDEETLCRFLVAREFDVQDAYRQYKATLEWRENNDIDNILHCEQPLKEDLKHILSYGFHKFDKEGRPCYIEKTGRADISALLKLPEEQIIRWHVWNTENQIAQMKRKSIELKKEITTLVHIHDLRGASLSMRKSLNLFTRLVKLDQEYYPERMGKVFIVNTPWIFPVLWKVAKSFLDPKTRDKCMVLGVTEQKLLLDYFNPEDLPEEYGGKCRCEHGCLPEVPKHMLLSEEQPELIEICIAPRKMFTHKVQCTTTKETIGWFYRISNKDVKFGILFREETEANKKHETWVVKPDYPIHAAKPNIGFHVCLNPGTYTLVWDNSDSRFMSRTLKYHVMLARQNTSESNVSNRSSSSDEVEL